MNHVFNANGVCKECNITTSELFALKLKICPGAPAAPTETMTQIQQALQSLVDNLDDFEVIEVNSMSELTEILQREADETPAEIVDINSARKPFEPDNDQLMLLRNMFRLPMPVEIYNSTAIPASFKVHVKLFSDNGLVEIVPNTLKGDSLTVTDKGFQLLKEHDPSIVPLTHLTIGQLAAFVLTAGSAITPALLIKLDLMNELLELIDMGIVVKEGNEYVLSPVGEKHMCMLVALGIKL